MLIVVTKEWRELKVVIMESYNNGRGNMIIGVTTGVCQL